MSTSVDNYIAPVPARLFAMESPRAALFNLTGNDPYEEMGDNPIVGITLVRGTPIDLKGALSKVTGLTVESLSRGRPTSHYMAGAKDLFHATKVWREWQDEVIGQLDKNLPDYPKGTADRLLQNVGLSALRVISSTCGQCAMAGDVVFTYKALKWPMAGRGYARPWYGGTVGDVDVLHVSTDDIHETWHLALGAVYAQALRSGDIEEPTIEQYGGDRERLREAQNALWDDVQEMFSYDIETTEEQLIQEMQEDSRNQHREVSEVADWVAPTWAQFLEEFPAGYQFASALFRYWVSLGAAWNAHMASVSFADMVQMERQLRLDLAG